MRGTSPVHNNNRSPSSIRRQPMKFLLALPFIGLLWVPFYNQETPTLFGFPFFY
ncbi:DUF3311 domain-containing protein, partial [Acinetobacter baumannii]